MDGVYVARQLTGDDQESQSPRQPDPGIPLAADEAGRQLLYIQNLQPGEVAEMLHVSQCQSPRVWRYRHTYSLAQLQKPATDATYLLV